MQVWEVSLVQQPWVRCAFLDWLRNWWCWYAQKWCIFFLKYFYFFGGVNDLGWQRQRIQWLQTITPCTFGEVRDKSASYRNVHTEFWHIFWIQKPIHIFCWIMQYGCWLLVGHLPPGRPKGAGAWSTFRLWGLRHLIEGKVTEDECGETIWAFPKMVAGPATPKNGCILLGKPSWFLGPPPF